MRPLALDLCSGAGGMSIGLEAAGYRTIGFDNWQPALDTHAANGLEAHRLDLMAVGDAYWQAFTGRVDLVAGGPPCQPFSAAGKGLGRYDPRDCVPGFIRAVRIVQPRWFLMENVRGLTFRKHADYLARVLADLAACGYVVEHRVLSAEEYGVPQTRQRLIILGVRDDQGHGPTWPTPTHRKYRAKVAQHEGDPGLLPWVSMAEALGWGLDNRPGFTVLAGGTDTGGAEVHGNPARKALAAWWEQRPSTTIVGSFRPDIVAAPGYRRKGDPPRQNTPGSVKVTEAEAATLQAFPVRVWGAGRTSGETAGARPRSIDEPSATVTGAGTAYVEQGDEGRRLTEAEVAIPQAFPHGFTFTGNSGTVYKQIGNAVPPPLAYVIGKANAATEAEAEATYPWDQEATA